MTPPPLVVVTNRAFPETRALLETKSSVVANDGDAPWSAQEVASWCGGATALMAFMTDYIDADFLAACPKLRVIGAALKGYDNIDIDSATKASIWVTVVPDLLSKPTAELAVGLILSLARHIRQGDRLIRENGFSGWRPDHYGTGLAGSTVGIVGFGRVGQAIAQCLSGFGCLMIAYDSRPRSGRADVEMMMLNAVLQKSDIVVLGLPLTGDTTGLIGAREIALMKPGALLVNPARGSLVDESAVADALDRGELGGYAADVFECEDWARPDRPDWVEPRLTKIDAKTVLTPHIGSAVTSIRRQIELSAARSIIDVLEGRVPEGAVNNPHSA